jgi:hypothetical protein
MWLISEVKKTLPPSPTPRQILNIASKIFDPDSHKLIMSSIAVKVAVYLEGKERKYATIRKCNHELELPDYDPDILHSEIPNHLPKVISPGIVIRTMRKQTYFVELPFENIIITFLQKNPGKSLRDIASRLPMAKEEFCDCITRLHEQKIVTFVVKSTVNGLVLLVYPPDSFPPPIPDEMFACVEGVTQLKEAVLQYPELNMRELTKKISIMKKSLAEITNYCIQTNIISVHVFLNNHEVDSKFFIADEKTLKVGYDALCVEHGEYVMIHQLRTYLNWSRNAFDSLLHNLERKGTIQLLDGDPGLMSTAEQKGMYGRYNVQKMFLFWGKA